MKLLKTSILGSLRTLRTRSNLEIFMPEVAQSMTEEFGLAWISRP